MYNKATYIFVLASLFRALIIFEVKPPAGYSKYHLRGICCKSNKPV